MLTHIRKAHEWLRDHPKVRRGLILFVGWAVGKLLCANVPVEYQELCNSGARLLGMGG